LAIQKGLSAKEKEITAIKNGKTVTGNRCSAEKK
jgi:hypothetical protein